MDINIVICLVKLLNQRTCKLPSILKYILIDSFEYSHFYREGTLFRQEQSKVGINAIWRDDF